MDSDCQFGYILWFQLLSGDWYRSLPCSSRTETPPAIWSFSKNLKLSPSLSISGDWYRSLPCSSKTETPPAIWSFSKNLKLSPSLSILVIGISIGLARQGLKHLLPFGHSRRTWSYLLLSVFWWLVSQASLLVKNWYTSCHLVILKELEVISLSQYSWWLVSQATLLVKDWNTSCHLVILEELEVISFSQYFSALSKIIEILSVVCSGFVSAKEVCWRSFYEIVGARILGIVGRHPFALCQWHVIMSTGGLNENQQTLDCLL